MPTLSCPVLSFRAAGPSVVRAWAVPATRPTCWTRATPTTTASAPSPASAPPPLRPTSRSHRYTPIPYPRRRHLSRSTAIRDVGLSACVCGSCASRRWPRRCSRAPRGPSRSAPSSPPSPSATRTTKAAQQGDKPLTVDHIGRDVWHPCLPPVFKTQELYNKKSTNDVSFAFRARRP